MAVSKSFREIAIANSKKQPDMVDQVLEEAPILANLPMQAASHGLWNMFEEQKAVTGAGLVDFDDELSEVDSLTELQQVDLSILGGKIYCGEDKARKFGSFSNYIQTKLPAILSQTGMDTEYSIIYNNLRQYAIDSSKYSLAGGSSNANYSIICVNWKPGQLTGLFDPDGFGKGALMDIAPISNGGLIERTVSGKSILQYGARLKSYVGIQLANPRYISSLCNVDTSNVPTEAEMDNLIGDSRATSGRSFLYMHPKVLTMLYAYKSSALSITNAEQAKDRRIVEWNGIPIVTSYNFLDGTETNVA